MRNNALKRITTIFCALTGMTFCSVNAKTYYVDKGSGATSGDCLWTITINDPEQEHIPLNEKAFNEWFNTVKFTAGDIIKIAGGHYTYKQITEKDDEESINDIPNGVTLAGSYDGTDRDLRSTAEEAKAWDFTHPTILDGNHQKTVLSTKSNSEAETPYTYIDGVVVCNGKNNGITGSNVDGSAGLFIQGKVEVRNCIIRNCNSKANGAGVYMISGRLIKSQIIGNTQTDNIKGGGGIYIDCRTNNLPSFMEDCLIESNTATTGAGIVLTGNKSIGIVNRCIIRNNNNTPVSQIADGSAIKVTTGEHIVNNCLIYNNSASNDASITRFSAIYMEHGNLLNTTVCNNIGAIFLSKNVVACQNNVCWNNTNPAGENIIQINTALTDKRITHNASCDDSGIFTAENNHILIDNKINEGAGNVNFINPTSFTGYVAPENPLFAQLIEEMSHADWNLNNNSVLLDKGDDTAIPNLSGDFTKDLLLNPRIKNSGIDIGAIEFQGIVSSLEKQSDTAVLIFYENGRVIFSENMNGYVTINNLNGALIAQKEVRDGMLEVELRPGYYLINWNKNAQIIVVR